ncbi:hypothetical protein NONO_c23510 [Nocardia nova SH22a]|uniref:Secreted protein n=1 Tax=Nocardia nova SH22a TaxID=1415166 RepID=W5TD16_9NOCA|nr:hypothetical protein [Nocardia nova]AHH17147.1 hypothetical protein NONO_c23510 [Nocardia nova SH22a]
MAVVSSVVRLSAAIAVTGALTFASAVSATAAPPDPRAAVAAAGAPVAASDLFGAYQSAVDGLKQLGIEPFLYPSASAFCQDGSTLGLVPALAGAVPGPWPRLAVPVPGLDLSAVKAGQTMFAFVPYGLGPDGADTSGMQVAWFNASTGRGGFAAMGPMSQIIESMIPPNLPPEVRPAFEQGIRNFFLSALPVGGVRAVPVDTGSGTVLAAMFGTVRNGDRTCLFLPTVGITSVP